MPDEREIADKLWKSIKSDRTIMLGLVGASADAKPMTALLDDDEGGPLWIFTSADTDLAHAIGDGSEAMAQFASKGHDLFAALHGRLAMHNDRAMIDALWNPFIAAWFEGGKDDPKLLLLRFDLDRAHVWLNEKSLFAGVKLLLGSDPKKDYRDKTADIRMR